MLLPNKFFNVSSRGKTPLRFCEQCPTNMHPKIAALSSCLLISFKLAAADDVAAVRAEHRTIDLHQQWIEGNPFDEADIALFDTFDRKGWSHERCIAHIRELVARLALNTVTD